MPLTNGDAGTSKAHLLFGEEIIEFTRAIDILNQEQINQDGVDAKTLLDSKKNGGLTYNDFLILPGYIGIWRIIAYIELY